MGYEKLYSLKSQVIVGSDLSHTISVFKIQDRLVLVTFGAEI